jgi:hypothetical protein
MRGGLIKPPLDTAVEIAEPIRRTIEAKSFSGLKSRRVWGEPLLNRRVHQIETISHAVSLLAFAWFMIVSSVLRWPRLSRE